MNFESEKRCEIDFTLSEDFNGAIENSLAKKIEIENK